MSKNINWLSGVRSFISRSSDSRVFDLSKLVQIVSVAPDGAGGWVYTSGSGDVYLLKGSRVRLVSKMDDDFAKFINSGHPVMKYFETESDGKTISYAANLAVDVVVINKGKVFLIERSDGRGWALPGGFIDLGESAKEAAIREFKEEALAPLDNISYIKALPVVRANDPREVNVYTFPFIVGVEDASLLGHGDDAVGSKWVLLASVVHGSLAFPHHVDIIKQVALRI